MLVARELTNRQVAKELVISERTAGNHVAHILTKLGFTSRTQIAGWCAARMSSPSPAATPGTTSGDSNTAAHSPRIRSG